MEETENEISKKDSLHLKLDIKATNSSSKCEDVVESSKTSDSGDKKVNVKGQIDRPSDDNKEDSPNCSSDDVSEDYDHYYLSGYENLEENVWITKDDHNRGSDEDLENDALEVDHNRCSDENDNGDHSNVEDWAADVEPCENEETDFYAEIEDEIFIRKFTEKEIKSFAGSMRKFCRPLERIRKVIDDANLDKPEADLLRLGKIIVEAFNESLNKLDEKYVVLKSGLSLKMAGLCFKKHMYYNRILEGSIPSDPREFHKWKLPEELKPANTFGVKWMKEDDLSLIIGVYRHGIGNWESIRNDHSLKLYDKILSPKLKTGKKHLVERLQYLISVIDYENWSKDNPQFVLTNESVGDLFNLECPKCHHTYKTHGHLNYHLLKHKCFRLLF